MKSFKVVFLIIERSGGELTHLTLIADEKDGTHIDVVMLVMIRSGSNEARLHPTEGAVSIVD